VRQAHPSELRYEIKLVCDAHHLAQARSWVRLHEAKFSTAYPPRRVNSLYLDTLHLSSLNDNLTGVSARQKLRLRWYGEAAMGIQPHLELKQKRNMLGRKKRFLLPCKLDLTSAWPELLRKISAHAEPEWHMMLQRFNQPTLFNHYQREYYVTPDGAIRVTLDFAQAAYDQRLSFRPNLHVRLPVADAVVIEIKADQEQAHRLREIAARFPIRRSRNSKYVNGLVVAMH